MNRHPDWRQRLHALVDSRHQAAFSWAENNGAIFTAQAVLAMTGRWLYPQSVKQAASEADKRAELAERAKLTDIERQLSDAAKELVERKQRLKAARPFVMSIPTAELPLLADDVEAQQTMVDDLRASAGQQALAVGIAAKRVMEAVMATVEAQGGVEVLVTKQLGEPLAGILLARDGDVLMAQVNTGGFCLGICDGAHGIFVSDQGLSRIRLLHCTRAWRVPETTHEWLNRRAARAAQGPHAHIKLSTHQQYAGAPKPEAAT